MQRMTDFCQTVSMLRLFETLIECMFCHRTAQYPVLLPYGRDTVHCLYGVIEIQPLRGCKKSVIY